MKWKSDLPTVTQLGNGRAGIWTHAGVGLSTKLLSCRLVKWPEPKGSVTPLVPPSFPTIHPDLGLWNTPSITQPCAMGKISLLSPTCIEWKEVKVTQLCLTLCNLMDYTVHGILQARILEWVAFPFSRGSSQPRDRTQVSHIAGGFFTSWAIQGKHLLSIKTYLGSL